MRPYIASFAAVAAVLALSACSGEVKVESGPDTTAAADTALVTPPMAVDTTAPVDTAATTTTTTTTTTETTPTTGANATTGGTTTTGSTTTTSGGTTTKPTTTSTTTSSSGTTTPPPTTSTPPPTTPTPPPATTSTPPTGASGDGKAIFTASKCNVCHSIASQGISKSMASSKAPDLAGTGKSAAWIASFLTLDESLNGKKHVKKFAGSSADLQSLASWIASLR